MVPFLYLSHDHISYGYTCDLSPRILFKHVHSCIIAKKFSQRPGVNTKESVTVSDKSPLVGLAIATITRCDLSSTILFKVFDSYLITSNKVASVQKNRGYKSERSL